MGAMTTVKFTLNGIPTEVPIEEAERKTLNEFLRFNTKFKGTKLSCGQGGCGACTVAMSRGGTPKSVSSCLIPLALVHGAAVLTVEGLKGDDGKPHPVSERLAKFNGTQCGFCTPGMVMRLYTELAGRQGGKNCKEAELEHCIDGNICRCTGYRPIIECAKSFASDTSVKNQLDRTVEVGPYDTAKDPKVVLPEKAAPLQGPRWRRPETLSELKAEMAKPNTALIAGGTSAGIYTDLSLAAAPPGRVFIDITAVPDLSKLTIGKQEMFIGSTVTWEEFANAISAMDKTGLNPSAAACLEVVRSRCSIIAGNQLRSMGTLGGNIAMTRNKGFWSDWVPMLAALGAKVSFSSGKKDFSEDLMTFISSSTPFAGLILGATLPFPSEGSTLRSFKIGHRGRFSYALGNAAFLARVVNGFVASASLVFGGQVMKPVRLPKAEGALTGVTDLQVQQNPEAVLKSLFNAGVEDLRVARPADFEERGPHLRAFLTKFLVALFKDKVPSSWVSADYGLHDGQRSSSATQNIPQPAALPGPFGQSMAKTTALDQTMGISQFVDDLPRPTGTLMATFVLVPEANVSFEGLDPEVAKSILGKSFHSLIAAEDLSVQELPEVMDCLTACGGLPPAYLDTASVKDWLLLPKGVPSTFGGQPVALLLGTTDSPKLMEFAAEQVAQALKLTRVGPPAMGPLASAKGLCEDAAVFSRDHMDTETTGKIIDEAKRKGAGFITGRVHKKPQAHFYMEPQSVLVCPDEGGLTIYAAAQLVDSVQKKVAAVTKLPQSKIAVKFRRLGGGFGGKAAKPGHLAALASDVALKLSAPIRLVLPRDTDTQIVGGRPEMEAEWRAAVEPSGRIKALEYTVWLGHGHSKDSQKCTVGFLGANIDMVYGMPNLVVKVHLVEHSVAARTIMRSPGHAEAIQLIEAVMNGVAAELGLPGERVREVNFYKGGSQEYGGLWGPWAPPCLLRHYALHAMWERMKTQGEYAKRKEAVDAFNRENAFRKRGITMMASRYGIDRMKGQTAKIDIFHDGSVQISLSGVEMGQGLHTKVGQIVLTVLEKALGAAPPMSEVRFLETSSEQWANAPLTGGSSTSECACFAAESAADKLLVTLKEAKPAAEARPTKNPRGLWYDIVDATFDPVGAYGPKSPLLSAMGVYRPAVDDAAYDTFGCAIGEVELDVLTGESRTLYAYVMFDSGIPANPMIDVGQLEGAFMQGLGAQLLEGVDYDRSTGKCLTPNTWTYKPPLAGDVPETFVVDMVDMSGERTEHPVLGCYLPSLSKAYEAFGYPWAPTPGDKSYKSSKAIGEPPLLLGTVVHSALSAAVVAARGRPLESHLLPAPADAPAVLRLLTAQE